MLEERGDHENDSFLHIHSIYYLWDQCNRKINRALNMMKELQEMRSATKQAQMEEILIDLRNMVSQSEPFSAVAVTCVRSQGVSWLSNAVILA